jgi:hypothetical protein
MVERSKRAPSKSNGSITRSTAAAAVAAAAAAAGDGGGAAVAVRERGAPGLLRPARDGGRAAVRGIGGDKENGGEAALRERACSFALCPPHHSFAFSVSLSLSLSLSISLDRHSTRSVGWAGVGMQASTFARLSRVVACAHAHAQAGLVSICPGTDVRVYVSPCGCVRVCVYVCVLARVCASVRACTCALVCVYARV